MPRERYKYNPETLSYFKVEEGFKDKFKRVSLYLMSSSFSGLAIFFIASFFIESPRVKEVKRENTQMNIQYQVMQKQLGEVEKVLDDIQQRDENIYRVIFEADPIPSSIRKAGFGGVSRYEDLKTMTDAEIIIATRKKLDVITKQLYIQSKSYDEVEKLALNKESMLQHIPAIQPVFNKDLKRMASGWGYRIHPIYKTKKFHYGMDFSAPMETEILATGDGVVKVLNKSRRGYGNEIVLDHSFGYQTRYGHLHHFNVKKGQKVKRGDIIGYVGNTGLSAGPHVHYEVIYKGKKVDPKDYYFNDLTKEQYDEMLTIIANNGQTLD